MLPRRCIPELSMAIRQKASIVGGVDLNELTDLAKIRCASNERRLLTGSVKSGEEHRNQQGDDPNYHQQFNQREPSFDASNRHVRPLKFRDYALIIYMKTPSSIIFYYEYWGSSILLRCQIDTYTPNRPDYGAEFNFTKSMISWIFPNASPVTVSAQP